LFLKTKNKIKKNKKKFRVLGRVISDINLHSLMEIFARFVSFEVSNRDFSPIGMEMEKKNSSADTSKRGSGKKHPPL
jgi:hypothetical protein